MPVTRHSLLNSVRTLCGEPPDLPLPKGLPSNLIFEELTSIEAEMLRDLDLSTQSQRVGKMEISLSNGDEEFSITASDFNAYAYAYLQTDGTTNEWYPVEIIDPSGLIQAGQAGRLAIGVIGQTGYLSWIPEGAQNLRIWYERNGEDQPELSASTELGNLYDQYLKLQTAAQCREHLGLKIGEVLGGRLARSEAQWNKYVNRGRQRGVGAKSPVFSYYRRNLDRTRFFLPR